MLNGMFYLYTPESLFMFLQTSSILYPVALVVKNLPINAGDVGDKVSIPGSGRSPGGGNDNPLQYSCLQNPIDRGTWQGYSPRGRKEPDTTEQLTEFLVSCMYNIHYIQHPGQ